MITAIIILAYVANVFLTRWMNKVLYQIDDTNPIATVIWFIPLFGFLTLLIIYLAEYSKSNWFTGKDW